MWLWGHPVPARRVVRGGSWNNTTENCRASYRNRNDPDNRNNNLGLRLVRRLGPHPQARWRKCASITVGTPSVGVLNGAGWSRLRRR
jgi:hypothetical protein